MSDEEKQQFKSSHEESHKIGTGDEKKTKTLIKEIGEVKKENRSLKKKNKDYKQLLKQKIDLIKECCNQINMCAENI